MDAFNDELVSETTDRIVEGMRLILEGELRGLVRNALRGVLDVVSDLVVVDDAEPKKKQRRQKAKPARRKKGKQKPGKVREHIDNLIGILSKTEGTKKFLLKKMGMSPATFGVTLTAARKDLRGKGLTIKSEGRGDSCTYKMVKR